MEHFGSPSWWGWNAIPTSAAPGMCLLRLTLLEGGRLTMFKSLNSDV